MSASGRSWEGARNLVFHEGPGRLLGKLGGESIEDAAPRLIQDGRGAEFARLKLEKRGGTKKAVDFASGMMGSAVGAGRIYDIDAVDPSGASLFRLHLQLGHLEVTDGDGNPIGRADNASRINGKRLKVEFFGPRKKRMIELSRGKVIAQLDAEPLDVFGVTPQPFVWRIEDPGGGLLATITHGEQRINELELEKGVEAPLRTLLIGFAAALFDRFWLQIPTSSGGGD